jgi:uncharacterized protein YwqG
MKEKAVELIRASGLSRIADDLIDQLLYSIRIRTVPVREDELHSGVSRIGGSPDLPSDIQWPERKGVPLAFVAQLRLPDITPYDVEGALPLTGLLYFFFEAEQTGFMFDSSDRDKWRVLYHSGDDDGHLHRVAAPSGLVPASRFTPQALRFSNEITLPPFESQFFERLGMTWITMYELGTAIEETQEEGERYFELMRQVKNLYAGDGIMHRILGHPDPIQGDMQRECQLASHDAFRLLPGGREDPRATSLAQGVTNWRLLLQIDSDDSAHMRWGDVGRIYYWIEREALASRNFAHAWLALQCY